MDVRQFMTMDSREFFILTASVELWVPIRRLASPNRGLAFNLRDPGFTGTDLIDTLDRLFQRGDLLAERTEKLDRVGGLFRPSRQQIDEALSDRLSLFYGLTELGGARWEDAAHPQWTKFIDASVGDNPPDGEATSSDRSLVEEYLANWSYIWREDSIVQGTETWEVLQPWRATYWKTLPIGHRVRFQVRPVEPEFGDDPPGFDDWFRSITTWYSDPD